MIKTTKSELLKVINNRLNSGEMTQIDNIFEKLQNEFDTKNQELETLDKGYTICEQFVNKVPDLFLALLTGLKDELAQSINNSDLDVNDKLLAIKSLVEVIDKQKELFNKTQELFEWKI